MDDDTIQVNELKRKILEDAEQLNDLTFREIFDKHTKHHPLGHKLLFKRMDSTMYSRRKQARLKMHQMLSEDNVNEEIDNQYFNEVDNHFFNNDEMQTIVIKEEVGEDFEDPDKQGKHLHQDLESIGLESVEI